MITYNSGGWNFLLNLSRVKGSVFPKALLISCPVGVVTGFITIGIHFYGMLPWLLEENSVMKETAVLSSFNFLVGFLVVFRTSQAYSRFWEGCTSTHKMGAEWFDACSSVMAFCKHSTVEEATVRAFQNTLIRLFSMLHAAALGEIEDTQIYASRGSKKSNIPEVEAFHMELIDADSIDAESLIAVRDCDAKVELIFQWIQQLIVQNIRTEVLSVPPPILSRAFQELANGMVHFHDAMKISNVPFPFPYAQTCDCILLLHWCLTPLVVSQWVINPYFAGMFSCMQVFTLWTLNLIAVELENPFGVDPNDIDGWGMQSDMNNHLRLLMRAETMRIPVLESPGTSTLPNGLPKSGVEPDLGFFTENIVNNKQSSFLAIWTNLDSDTAFRRRRNQAGTTKRDKMQALLKGMHDGETTRSLSSFVMGPHSSLRNAPNRGHGSLASQVGQRNVASQVLGTAQLGIAGQQSRPNTADTSQQSQTNTTDTSDPPAGGEGLDMKPTASLLAPIAENTSPRLDMANQRFGVAAVKWGADSDTLSALKSGPLLGEGNFAAEASKTQSGYREVAQTSRSDVHSAEEAACLFGRKFGACGAQDPLIARISPRIAADGPANGSSMKGHLEQGQICYAYNPDGLVVPVPSSSSVLCPSVMAKSSDAPPEVYKRIAKEETSDVAGTSDIWLDTTTQARLQEIFTDLEMWGASPGSSGFDGSEEKGNA